MSQEEEGVEAWKERNCGRKVEVMVVRERAEQRRPGGCGG